MDLFIKYKKQLIITGFIFFILLTGYIIYALFLKPATEENKNTGPGALNNTAMGGLPLSSPGRKQTATSTGTGILPAGEEEKSAGANRDLIAKGGLTQVSEINSAKTLGAVLNSSGNGLKYYNKDDSKFYQIDENGQIKTLSDKVFHSVDNVVWSPNKNKAILEYPDGANIIYDFDNTKQITLPSHWQDFNYSPSGDKLIMKSMGLDPDNRWLAVVNEDGSQVRALEPLGTEDATVYPSWSPNNQSVAMYTKGVDFYRQEVYFVGLNDENFKSMIIEGRGFQSKWSPQGDKLLYSVYANSNNLKPLLWIANAQGDNIGTNRKNLNIETWADKCVFSSNTEIYCAIPNNLQEGAGLFLELAGQSSDQLYKIDTATGIKKLIAVPDGSYNMSDLNVTKDGSRLYFTDKTTEKLYNIKLK